MPPPKLGAEHEAARVHHASRRRGRGWPLAARGQQPALPVVGYVRAGSSDLNARNLAAFRKGLTETGYVEGQNVTVEYHWLEVKSSSVECRFRWSLR